MKFIAAAILLATSCVGFSARSNAQSVPSDRSHEFIVFTTRADAIAWSQKSEDDYARYSGIAARKMRPADDPLYDLFQQRITSTWGAFKDAFPQETESLPAPQLVIIEDAHADGYMSYDYESQKVPWFVSLTTGLLNSPISSKGIQGLVAHEFAHGTFKHSSANNAFQAKAYFKEGEKEPLGFEQRNNEEAMELYKNWRNESRVVGDIHLSELNGLPYSTYGDSFYQIVLSYIERTYYKNAECASLKTQIQNYRALLSKNTSRLDRVVTLSTEDLAELTQISTKALSTAKSCYVDLPHGLFEILDAFFGGDARQAIRNNYGTALLDRVETDAASFDPKNPFLSLTKITGERQATARKFEAHSRFSQLRIFTTEEDADDKSVLVMRKLGKATAISDFVLLPLSNAERENCFNILERGQIPNYGSLLDPHHGRCYRVFHARAFNASLK